MDVMQDYFVCDSCRNRDFTRIYNFSIRFYTVNFSDELVYDRLTDEIYQCTKCNKTFTKEQIDNVLAEFKKRRKTKG
jgi:ribosomal protein L37AE/L43A